MQIFARLMSLRRRKSHGLTGLFELLDVALRGNEPLSRHKRNFSPSMPDELPHEPQTGLGKAVRALREEARIDQATLAERANLPIDLIAEIESGQSDPTWGDMRRVAAALSVSLEALSELAEELEAESD